MVVLVVVVVLIALNGYLRKMKSPSGSKIYVTVASLTAIASIIGTFLIKPMLRNSLEAASLSTQEVAAYIQQFDRFAGSARMVTGVAIAVFCVMMIRKSTVQGLEKSVMPCTVLTAALVTVSLLNGLSTLTAQDGGFGAYVTAFGACCAGAMMVPFVVKRLIYERKIGRID